MLTVYPVVHSLSSSQSGLNGGHTLVVNGSGFDTNCSRNTVVVQGVPCALTSCTQTTLSCTVGPAPAGPQAPGPYASSRGLLHRVYHNIDAANSVGHFISQTGRYPNLPNITRVEADAINGFDVNFAFSYGQQYDGYFVPKVTALHQFYISSDDGSDLFMSFNNTVSNLTLIASAPWYLSTYWSHPATQISRPLLLQAGQPYMIRVRHTQGWGGDFLNVAVRIADPNPRSPLEVRQHSVHERQTLQITSAVRREVQRLNFTAPNNNTAVSGTFMFFTNSLGARSPVINITGSSSSEVANAISVCPGKRWDCFCVFCAPLAGKGVWLCVYIIDPNMNNIL
jgi:hypothetical protein